VCWTGLEVSQQQAVEVTLHPVGRHKLGAYPSGPDIVEPTGISRG
jgi:hypothetical protein